MKRTHARKIHRVGSALLLFLLLTFSLSLYSLSTIKTRLTNILDDAVHEFSLTVEQIQEDGSFIADLPAVRKITHQTQYDLKSYLELRDELDAFHNSSTFSAIRLVHFNSRKIYETNYGLYDLSRTYLTSQDKLLSQLLYVKIDGFYQNDDDIVYYLPLPRTGQTTTALLTLSTPKDEFFRSFSHLPVCINFDQLTYQTASNEHPLDQWISYDNPKPANPWKRSTVDAKIQMNNTTILKEIGKSSLGAILFVGLVWIVLHLRTRHLKRRLDYLENRLIELAVLGPQHEQPIFGHTLDQLEQNIEALFSQVDTTKAELRSLKEQRREKRRHRLLNDQARQDEQLEGFLWLAPSVDSPDFIAEVEKLIDEQSEIFDFQSSVLVAFYHKEGAAKGDDRAYDLFYSLDDIYSGLNAIFVPPPYVKMKLEDLLTDLEKSEQDVQQNTFSRYTNPLWLEKAQAKQDYSDLLTSYAKALDSKDGTEADHIFQALLQNFILYNQERSLAEIFQSARELGEAILGACRKLQFTHADHCYPEFITAILVLEQQMSITDNEDNYEATRKTTLQKLEHILEFWNERIQKSARRSDSQSDAQIHVKRALHYIRENFRDPDLTSGFLSDKLNLNPTYFGRIFKEITQKTPSDYLTDMRLNAALQELRQLREEGRDISLEEIAIHSGFGNQRSFTRFFKINMGLTPTQWLAKKDEENEGNEEDDKTT